MCDRFVRYNITKTDSISGHGVRVQYNYLLYLFEYKHNSINNNYQSH